MKNFAVIKSGLVVDRAVWDGNEGEGEVPFSELAWPGHRLVELPEDSSADIGWSYANGEFLAPQIAPQPVVVPVKVSMRQARLALLAAGLYDSVQAAVAEQGEAARIEWEFATDIERTSATVTLLAGALGMSESDLDELFTVAATL